MKNVVILTHGSYSHNKAIIPVIKELKKRDIDVYVFIEEEVSENYIKENIEFILYPKEIKEYIENNIIYDSNEEIESEFSDTNENMIYKYLYNMARYNIETNNAYTKYLVDIIDRIEPDLIIRDTCSFFGKTIGNILDIKVVGYICNFVFERDNIFENYIEDFAQAWGINLNLIGKEKFIKIFDKVEFKINDIYNNKNIASFNLQYMLEPKEDLNLVFSSQKLHPEVSTKSYRIVKYSLFSNDESINKNKKIIYVSTGSMQYANINFYLNIIAAFKDSEYKVIISHKNPNELTDGFDIPDNIIIKKFVDQKSILKEASLFISHGGYNSICEAIYYEVPLIVYPLSRDQFLNASIVDKNGIGIDARRFIFNNKNINKIANILLNNDMIKNNISNIKNDFYNNSDNIEAFVDYIVSIY